MLYGEKERQVREACEALLLQGIKPEAMTLKVLSQCLEKLDYIPGNLHYLTRYRNRWREEQREKQQTAEEKILSTENKKQDVLDRATAMVREAIQKEVQEEFEKKLETIREERHALEEEKLLLAENLDDLQERYSEQETENVKMKVHVKEIENALQEHEKSLSESTARLDAQTTAMEKRELDFHLSYSDMKKLYESQIGQLSTELCNQRAQHHQAIDMLRDLNESQRHQWIDEKDAFKTEQQKTQKIMDTLKEQLTTIKTQYQQKTEQCENLETQYQKVLHQIDDLQAHCQAYGERIAALTVENQNRQENYEAVQRDYHAELSQLKNTISTLQDTLIRVENATKQYVQR